ncbi:hypothetical protein DXG03_007173 [Asterophora parasitica]|uniref:Replication protein A subunit n=1 Tax=Asterophora parasitica TaxID=117018 RepID=A0A9P7GD92_9AGAR|nr:hypothetical protein DXG03_007173 [Asterophora parasitica]
MDVIHLLPSPPQFFRLFFRLALSLFTSTLHANYRRALDERRSHMEFDIDSETGFFPPCKLPQLPKTFHIWEHALSEANEILYLKDDDREEAIAKRPLGEAWRSSIRAWPVLDTEHLQHDLRLLQRAHLVLAWLVNFYVHSQPPRTDSTADILIPKSLALPLVAVSRCLGIAPVLTFADTVLWNCEPIDPSQPLSSDNIQFTNLFSRTEDERNFYLASARAELRGVEMLRIIDDYTNLPTFTDLTTISKVSRDLNRLAGIIGDISEVIQSVRSMCDPHAFYFDIRPWFEGSGAKGPNAPKWIYEGVEDSENLDLSGPSAGQSSVMHALDLFLDIDHTLRERRVPAPSESNKRADHGFMDRMRRYMPGRHREYLNFVAATPKSVRVLAQSISTLRDPLEEVEGPAHEDSVPVCCDDVTTDIGTRQVSRERDDGEVGGKSSVRDGAGAGYRWQRTISTPEGWARCDETGSTAEVLSCTGTPIRGIPEESERQCYISHATFARPVTLVDYIVTSASSSREMVQLTAGCCARLATAPPENEELFNGPHTVQFLSIKKVNAGNPGGVDRFRIIMSDGINFLQAMLATQLNGMVNDQTIGKHTVAVIEKLTCNYVQEKRLIIILALRVLETAADKIGDPKPLTEAPDPPQPAAPAQTSVAAASSSSSNPSVQRQQTTNFAPSPAVRGSRGSIFPIEGLSPYQNNWTIKARVIQKSDIKTWSNAKGEGKLFNVTLMDETGEIRGTGFNTAVDELYPRLEEGKVYYISKARVNLAKKKFSNVANDYELSFERNTEVEECHEASNLPMIKYHFVNLSGLEDLPKDSTCDVIAIVKEIPKRELTLVDQSGYSVRLTLWGKQAEQYNAEDNPVIAFKGVKVGDFGGRSLSMYSSSTMAINPDIDECFTLRGWYDSSGSGQSFQAQSNSGGATTSGFRRSEMRSINEVKEAQLGQQDKVDFFSIRGTIMHIKADNICYPACPTAGCNKKVIEVNGNWRCEKCSKSFEAPEYRYIMALAVADWSGQAWLQGFNDVGLAVFGMPANDLVEIRDNNESKFNVILHKANCTTYNFACRAKQDEYNVCP